MNLFQKSFNVFLSNWVVLIVHLIVNIIIARVLGPENKGIIALIIAGLGLLTFIGNMGVQNSAVYFEKKQKYNSLSLMTGYIILQAVFFLVFCILLLFFQSKVLNLIFGDNQNTQFYILPIILYLPVLLIKNYLLTLALGRQNVKEHRILTSGSALGLIFFSSIAYISLNLSVLSVIISFCLADLIPVVIILVKHYRKEINKNIIISFPIIKDLLAYGVKSQIIPLGSTLLLRIDYFILIYYFSTLEVGVYSVAQNFFSTLLTIPLALNTMLFGKTSELNKQDAGKYVLQPIKLIFLMMSLVTGILILCIPLIIDILFGKQFSSAGLPSIILVVSTVFMGASGLVQPFFMGIGKPQIPGTIMLLGGISKLLLGVLLVPLFGLNGLAASTLISILFITALRMYFYMKESNINRFSELFINMQDVRNAKTKLAAVLRGI